MANWLKPKQSNAISHAMNPTVMKVIMSSFCLYNIAVILKATVCGAAE